MPKRQFTVEVDEAELIEEMKKRGFEKHADLFIEDILDEGGLATASVEEE